MKLENLGSSLITCLVPFLSEIFNIFIPFAQISKTFIFNDLSPQNEFIVNIKDISIDNNLIKSETAYLIMKNILKDLGNYLYPNDKAINLKLFKYINFCPGIIIGITLDGESISKSKKIYYQKDETQNLSLYSESFYYQYIPKKFREYCIPTLCWKGVSKNAKSFAIELIEDGYRKWLVINIKKWIRKINNENYLDVGDNIVEYKGISKHPYKVSFILYEMKKELSIPEEWGVGKDIKKDYIEELSQFFNQVAVLNAY